MKPLKHLIDTNDYSKEELMKIINLSLLLKDCINKGFYPPLLKNQTLGMIFQQVSTRTRVSLETAMTQLGGHAQFYAPGSIQLGGTGHESLEDSARVLSKLCDILVARVDEHSTVKTLAKYSSVPVINAMSDYCHPTQELGDVCTMIEYLPEGKKLEDCKIVYVGDTCNVGTSIGFIATKLGMTFVNYGPDGYGPTKEVEQIMDENCRVSGGKWLHTNNRSIALKDADFIYTDMWCGVYNHERTPEERQAIFKDYQINMDMIKECSPHVKFMHCLPASRGEEVTDEVMDSKYSVVFDEAHNRLTAMRGILVYLSRNKAIDEKEQQEIADKLDSFLLQNNLK